MPVSAEPRLSVITITYKDPAGLAATSASLAPLLRAGSSWEHVVVDSSPEENRDVLAGLPPGWPLVHAVAPARGIYPAMNEGIRRASGRYLWFLNGRDRLRDAAALDRLLARMESSPELQLVGAAVERVRRGEPEYRWTPGRDFYGSNMGACHVCHQGVIYRRDCFERVGLFDETYRLSGDYQHHLRCWLNGIRAAVSAECIADFDLSGAGSIGWADGFVEVGRIHRTVSQGFPLRLRLLHRTMCRVHFVRVHTIKALERSAVGKPLQRLWHWWKRRRLPLQDSRPTRLKRPHAPLWLSGKDA
jgi:putative colanic acid biosynthesis glycosyltransferase